MYSSYFTAAECIFFKRDSRTAMKCTKNSEELFSFQQYLSKWGNFFLKWIE